jgi:hypothetical protein
VHRVARQVVEHRVDEFTADDDPKADRRVRLEINAGLGCTMRE